MFWILAVALFLLAGGTVYEQAGRAWDRRRYPPLGRLVDIGSGRRLHVLEAGKRDGPTVVLEAGLAGSLMGWALVQSRIAQFAHVISYDRAGLGWSDAARGGPTVDGMVGELAAVLRGTQAQRPYILVGHSFGGMLVRAFAHRFPDEVAGLVLVDPVAVESWANCSSEERAKLRRGAQLSRRGALLARFGVVRAALSLLAGGGRFVPNLISKSAAGKGSSVIERLVGEVRLLPREHSPRIRSHWSASKGFRAMAAYLECLPASAQAVRNVVLPEGIPVTVLSAGTATEAELAERDAWVAHSSQGRHMRVADSSHWIQIRRPELVIDAIREMVRGVTASLERSRELHSSL